MNKEKYKIMIFTDSSGNNPHKVKVYESVVRYCITCGSYV